ncbi:MAG: DNA repair protein RadC [Gemmatimonadota bacterium]
MMPPQCRERLAQYGPAAIATHELLAETLNLDPDKARSLADEHLARLGQSSLTELAQLGLTPKQALRLTAALELSRRVLKQGLGILPTITGPTDLLPHIVSIKDQPKEHFLVLYLNARNQVVHQEVISVGSLSSAIVHPREVYRPGIERGAASIVLCHNHPSADCTPSREDLELTRRLVQAGQLLGIEVLDHVIVAATDFLSLKERGLM